MTMIPIKLNHVPRETIEHIIDLSKQPTQDNVLDQENVETDMEKSVETIIENYLMSDKTNKPALSQLLASLSKDELAELLALYYFFSKLTYDTETVTKEGTESFWKLCLFNAVEDVSQKSLTTMAIFLLERPNLSVILSTALINIEW
tara:strand:+ start:665 stop:1105 length:441 start_codon:yes stop_codon:yes gene_type:complete